MIFQALGSNYTYGYAWRHLLSRGADSDKKQLENSVAEKFGGKAVLFSKGRDALSEAVRLAAKGGAVAVNGATCSVVAEAVIQAGAVPVYIDIDQQTGNMSLTTLEAALADTEVKAVIVQNTYGNMIDIAAVEKLTKPRGITIIEDLAHGLGQVYPDGRPAGTVGELVMMSFGRDKIIDAVNGGALVLRSDELQKQSTSPYEMPPSLQQRRDRWYPLLSCLVRSLYQVGLGKYFLAFIYKVKWAVRSADGGIHSERGLPNWQAKMIYEQWQQLDDIVRHRTKIMTAYQQELGDRLLTAGGTIRAALLVENRAGLLNNLARRGYFLHDTWYDVPIAPARKYDPASYPEKDQPETMAFTRRVINLPTHRHVSVNQARRLAKVVKQECGL